MSFDHGPTMVDRAFEKWQPWSASPWLTVVPFLKSICLNKKEKKNPRHCNIHPLITGNFLLWSGVLLTKFGSHRTFLR